MSVEARLTTKAWVRRLGIALAVLLAGVMGLPVDASVAVAATPVGVQWTSQTSAANTQWTSMAWGGPVGSQLFVAVGRYLNGTVTTVMTSPDGLTWTSRTATANVYWTSVAWGGAPGSEKFVAVALEGNVMTSPDGITWTSRTPAIANKMWKSVTWGGPAGQEQFVAVNSNNASDAVMTSPDGVTWTARTIPSNGMWASVTWGGATGNQKFVAVAGFGVASCVMTSSDGITWAPTPVAAPSGGRQWSSVAWGGPAGNQRFVAVAANAPAGDRLMTSPDGLTWTTSNQVAADMQWNAVAWGGPVGDQTFVAVAGFGSGNRVVTSPDGITWTSQTSPIDSWAAVTWGGPAGGQKFVAVAASGGVMTSVSTLTAPGTPSIASATPTETTAALAFTADDSGGSVITRLEFALDDTTTVDDSTTNLASPFTLTGLAPGTAYTVYVRAVNAIGAGPWSTSQAFTTVSPPTPVTYPAGAPTDVVAVAGNASAVVSWTAPTESGSYPVTSYQVVSTPGGSSCLVTAPTRSCEVQGLRNGTSYTFAVRALNGAGWGAPSAPSNAVIPQATPTPTIQITGSRDSADPRVVRVSGTTTHLAGGQLTPWVKYPGEPYTAGISAATVAADGTFAWTRKTNKRI